MCIMDWGVTPRVVHIDSLKGVVDLVVVEGG
jgi:hypothetical protein